MRIAQEEKQKADQLAVLDADKQLSALETNLQYNPQTGAMNRKGKDAFGLPDQIKSDWGKGIEEIQKNLHNDTQRMAFERSETSRWASLDSNIQRHVSGEIQKYDSEVTESYLANERDAASVNYMEPDRIALSLERQRTAIADHAQRNGLPSEWVKLKISDSDSKTALSVLNRMLANGQDQLAKKSYDAYKHMLTGKDATDAEKSLKEGTLRGESQRSTDQLMQSYESWGERLNKANDIKDPEIRDEVNRRLKTNMATEKLVEQQTEEQMTQAATNIIEASKNFDDVPPSMISKMSASTRKSLRGYADDLKEGKKAVTDWNEYYGLKTMAATPELHEKFLRENLMAYRSNLADGELKELITLQTTLRQGKDDPELDGYRTNAMIVNDTSGKKEMEKVNQFRKLVDDQITAYQRQTGKKANNKEIQGIVDHLIIKGAVPGSGFMGIWKTEKRAFELAHGEAIIAEDKQKISYGGIPADDRSKIMEALKANNIPITDEKVLSLYLRKVHGAN